MPIGLISLWHRVDRDKMTQNSLIPEFIENETSYKNSAIVIR